MGKKNRRKGERPKRQVIPGMAEDRLPPADPNSLEYERRDFERHARGKMFLLNYLQYADDGGFSHPGHGAPRKDDETVEQYEERRDLTRRQVELQALLGTWAEQAAEDLRYIMPSDAYPVAGAILGQGYRWCQAAGFQFGPEPDDMRAGAGPLLDAMCPPEHRAAAEDALIGFWVAMKLGPDQDPIQLAAETHPLATIHVAAAITAWMYRQPEYVPDRVAARMPIINQCLEAAKHL
jgi:hypothetical protein